MEIEMLSNYEPNRENGVDKTMEVDRQSNEEKSVSPVNKVYEESTEISESKASETDQENKGETTTTLDNESDEECEEEEEKLLLSPAHSYEGAEPLSPVNRDLLDSDCEGEKEELDKSLIKDIGKEEDVSDKLTAEAVKKPSEVTETENDEKSSFDKENLENQLNVSAATNINNVEHSQQSDQDKLKDDISEKNINQDDQNKNKTEKVDINNQENKNDENKDEDNENKQSANAQTLQDPQDNKSYDVIENDKSVTDTKDKDVTAEEFKDSAEKDKVDCEKQQNDLKSCNEEKAVEDSDCIKDKVESFESKISEAKNDIKEIQSTKIEENINNESNGEESKNNMQIDDAELKEPDGEDEIDMDEDFDPSLLMPELSMEVDEVPVITNSDAPAPEIDGNKSPLRLYDPIFSTFVDEMTGAEVDFDLTTEELELKVKTYGSKNPVQFTKIHCTACNIHLGSALDGQGNRFVHPLLKVLICKKCYHFYTSGEFEKDEDGSELYCRWCGQGGQVMCCSNCEMVFCKKCIRINFDRKKLAEIQKSEEWTCFRCNPSQLIHLRIHCAEFMEYVQREMRNVGSSGNPEAFMIKDHCQCCIPQKKKASEPTSTTQSKKRKRNLPEEDPDYNPREAESPPLPVPMSTLTPSKMPILTPGRLQTLNRSPLIRPVLPQQSRLRPQIATTAAIRSPAAVRSQTGFVRLTPSNAGVRGVTSTSISSTRPPALCPIRPVTPANKHEWFEKTVRAAARVNSNLSYTLTQLNRAQANATSVEALAVVHNKLQEILSSSINSLIQIRKNLRTEFISGIKNIRFPPKQQTTSEQTTSSKDDDDVIFVPSDPSPPSKTTPTIQKTPNVSQGVSAIKNHPGPSTLPKAGPSGITRISNSTPDKSVISNSSSSSNSSNSSSSTSIQPKGFLRVKSFSALQNVTSECITIPDDPPEDTDVEPVIEKDPLSDEAQEKREEASHTNGIINGGKDSENIPSIVEDPLQQNDTKEVDMSKTIKDAKIVLERCNEIDELVKNRYGIVNGNGDESA